MRYRTDGGDDRVGRRETPPFAMLDDEFAVWRLDARAIRHGRFDGHRIRNNSASWTKDVCAC